MDIVAEIFRPEEMDTVVSILKIKFLVREMCYVMVICGGEDFMDSH